MFDLEIPRVISSNRACYPVSCDCDCACVASAPMQVANKIQPPKSMPLKRSSKLESISLNGRESVFFIPSSTNNISTAVVNVQAQRILDEFGSGKKANEIIKQFSELWPESIVENVISDLIALEFLVHGGGKAREESFVEQPTVLNAWIHLTDRCNFNCSYCFLPHDKNDMVLNTGQSIIDKIVQSALSNDFDSVKIKYAGGEPLLMLQLLIELQKYAIAKTTKANIGLEAVVLSNGTLLTPEKGQLLKELGIDMTISVDGIENYHDFNRSYVNQRSSYHDVLRGIDTALSAGLEPGISITVSGRSIDGLPSLVEWILKKEMSFTINFYRENNLSRCFKDLELEEERIIQAMQGSFRAIENNFPKYSLLTALSDRVDLSHGHIRPCGVGYNYLVFDHKGRVSKCHMAMSATVTDISAGDSLALIRDDETGIQNVTVDEKMECTDCQWKYWCSGGCPLSAFNKYGRYSSRSPYCSIYKALIPEILRLEGMRLLHFN